MGMHAQEKELEHLKKSLAALSGEPCSSDVPRPQPHTSRVHPQASGSRPQQDPWQPAHSKQCHPQNHQRLQDLWPDEDALPDGFDAGVQQQRGPRSNGTATEKQTHRNQPSNSQGWRTPPQTALPNELHLESSSHQRRPERNPSSDRPRTPQLQPYVVTEPDSPRSLTTVPAGCHHHPSSAQPIIITETTVTRSLHLWQIRFRAQCNRSGFKYLQVVIECTFQLIKYACRTLTPTKGTFGRQSSWTVQEVRQFPTDPSHERQPSFYAGMAWHPAPARSPLLPLHCAFYLQPACMYASMHVAVMHLSELASELYLHHAARATATFQTTPPAGSSHATSQQNVWPSPPGPLQTVTASEAEHDDGRLSRGGRAQRGATAGRGESIELIVIVLCMDWRNCSCMYIASCWIMSSLSE